MKLYVLAFLYVGDTILLLRRVNTEFGNGFYGLAGGKVEDGERALQAIKREVHEEVNLNIPESDFKLVHAFHRKGTDNELVALCFAVDISKLEKPLNMEPEKHDVMTFFKLNDLPNNIIEAHKQAIECIGKNINYSEHGW